MKEVVVVVVMVLVLVVVIGATRDSRVGCGCHGLNQVYYHGRAPVSGWYYRNKDPYYQYFGPYVYRRSITLGDRGTVDYLLEYVPKEDYWFLAERTETMSRTIASNRREPQLNIMCPNQCSCRNISIEVGNATCKAIMGIYTRSDLMTDPTFPNIQHGRAATKGKLVVAAERKLPAGTSSTGTLKALHPITNTMEMQPNPHIMNPNLDHMPVTEGFSGSRTGDPVQKSPRMSPLERSSCLLSNVARCLKRAVRQENLSMADQEGESSREGGRSECREYVKVLSPTISSPLSVVYHMEIESNGPKMYTLSMTDDGGFWWIERGDSVYAVSSEGGPCPDQLTDGNQWHLVSQQSLSHYSDGHPGQPLTLTCLHHQEGGRG